VRRWHGKTVVRAIALVFGLVCVVYLVLQLRAHWPAIRKLDWTGATIAAFAICVVLQVVAMVFAAWCWGWTLRALDVPAPSRKVISIFCVSQFGKYLPGNVGQHVGRLALSREAGFQTGRVVVSMFLENAFAIGAGALIAAVGVMLMSLGGGWSLPRVALAIALAASSWLAGTWLLRYLLGKPPARLRAWLALERPIQLPASLIAGYFVVHILSYVVMGLVLALLLHGMTGTWIASAWTLPVAVTISWLAGFLTPGAPAGLGVREAALTSILGETLDTSVVLSLALLSRLTMMLADVLALLLGLLLREGRTKAPAARADPAS